jgi:hypothetical protein
MRTRVSINFSVHKTVGWVVVGVVAVLAMLTGHELPALLVPGVLRAIHR